MEKAAVSLSPACQRLAGDRLHQADPRERPPGVATRTGVWKGFGRGIGLA
jgi:hypothetical protein